MNNAAIITIDKLSLLLNVGLLPHECKAPQTVNISLKLYADIAYLTNASEDNLINYGAITERLKEIENAEHIDLLETLMMTILDIVFAYKSVHTAHVTIIKPDIIAEADGVGIETIIDRRAYENGL